MKRLTPLALFLVALLGMQVPMGTPARAATDTQKDAMQLRIEELRSRLNLTSEQEAALGPLVQGRNARLQALRGSSDGEPSRRERRALVRQARTIQEEFIGKAEPLLSKEQMREWEKIRAEMRDEAINRWRTR